MGILLDTCETGGLLFRVVCFSLANLKIFKLEIVKGLYIILCMMKLCNYCIYIYIYMYTVSETYIQQTNEAPHVF